jgi:hypothetical protein
MEGWMEGRSPISLVRERGGREGREGGRKGGKEGRY